MPRDEEWLTPKEVAHRFGNDPETVRRWHRRGIVRSKQVGEEGAIYIRWPLIVLKPAPEPRVGTTPDDT